MMPGIKAWPGYAGLHSRDQAEGALPNGQRVVKVNSENGDSQRDGRRGTILGSLNSPKGIFYFVEWDTLPAMAVGTASFKLAAIDRK
jgi:hypothetical protein